MNWYAIFAAGATPANSDPVSTGTVIDPAALQAADMTSIQLSGDPAGLVWQRSTQTFVAPFVVTTLSTVEFMALFSQAERVGIRTSTDPAIQDFVWQTNNARTITLSDPVVVNGLAYWNGNAVVYAFLCEDGSGLVVEEFDLNDFVWSEFDAQFTEWSTAPKFSERAEVKGWLMDAPPYEAG
ncbi:hypothetical protein CI15_33530 [Paraburkholderia monticola]|uniref:Uncharacterized protein n=1 Tax=Paraburkholderia monticola TaxID=1399968 RepID=A0A149PBP8_9BURK|nr:hypothetical protein [Paraburkholderia monticola]KXU82454.1 hypothetical protein CI15_33530 [Paraburkholderia monticola]